MVFGRAVNPSLKKCWKENDVLNAGVFYYEFIGS
jgi:hypothetical protein